MREDDIDRTIEAVKGIASLFGLDRYPNGDISDHLIDELRKELEALEVQYAR